MLVVVATLPAFAVLLSLQHEVRSGRLNQARDIASQQVILLDQSFNDIMIGVQALLTATADLPAVARLEPGCGGNVLEVLRAALPLYTSVAVLRSDGSLVCNIAPAALPAEFAGQLASLARGPQGFVVGPYAVLASDNPVLLVALGFPATDAGPGGAIVAGLSLQWLSRRLQQPLHRPDAGILLADSHGTVLANLVAEAPGVGGTLPLPLERLLSARSPGVELEALSTGLAGGAKTGAQRVAGYIPPASEAYGLFVAVAFDVNDVTLGLNAAAARGYLLLASGAALSVLLAMIGAHLYVRNPATVLVRAAEKWAAGALDVRAVLPAACPSEFNEIGHAFNRMAEMLQQQRGELQRMNDALELRVAERTGALLTSNNRLQVEIAERELSESNLRQAQKLQAVGQLAAGIAHNFNNLLGAMLGSIELLQTRLAQADGSHLRLLEIAKSAVSRGSWLTSQLLAFSRKQPMVATAVNMAEAIGGVEALLRSTLGPGTRISVQVGPDLWPAMIDANQFEVAILNLALNAREAMPEGGRLTIAAANTTLTPSHLRADLPMGDYVRVDVADTGHGMTAEVAARAFEPFFTTKTAGQNAGLGLSQVHGMVTQMGGAITIDSGIGNGTRVSIMLPRSPALPRQYVRDQSDGARAVLPPERLVLLVDDDDEVREVTAGILEDVGYAVAAVADGAAALAVLDREGPRIGLVIADYAMPGMTGLELLTAVRRRRPDLPMLLATGYADHQSLSGDGLEPDQIVRKPFRSAELLGRITMVVERQAALAG